MQVGGARAVQSPITLPRLRINSVGLFLCRGNTDADVGVALETECSLGPNLRAPNGPTINPFSSAKKRGDRQTAVRVRDPQRD